MRDLVMTLFISTYVATTGEVDKIRKDERGMELLQAIFLILMAVIIAAVLWAFLADWISELLKAIEAGGTIGD